MPSKKFIEVFGPVRGKTEKITQRHKDIAASLQKIVEETVFRILNQLYKETRCKNLCMAGGVSLNSVLNGKIIKETPFKKVFIQPAASDAGGSLGAAIYFYNSILGKKRNYVMDNVYLGPKFTTEDIRRFLEKNSIKFKEFEDNDELVKKTAELIYNNKIIGFFQGRLEFGPRALGNRSILANPCNPKMKDILNKKVKHREEFRPFAPSITYENYRNFFDTNSSSPFMLFVYPIKKEKQKLVPSITHIDGTGRLQTVKKNQNPLFWNLIKEFEKISEVPILINTSFNVRGEPIVCAPEHAYKCMMGTGIDYLVIDKFLVSKNDNKKDIWDSKSFINED